MKDRESSFWSGAIGISSDNGIPHVGVGIGNARENGMSVRNGLSVGVGGDGGNESTCGEGAVDEAGLENVGMGLVEFRDGSGHLCE